MAALRTPVAVLVFSCALAGCNAEPPAPEATFVLRGSGHAAPTAPGVESPQDMGSAGMGAASLSIGLYALSVSASTDCSAPIVVQDHGAAPTVVDFMAGPVLFSGSPPDGAYPCLILRMSDVLHFQPDADDRACVAGADYTSDIYREGQADWRDVNHKLVVGHGTDRDPVDDGVTLFLSTDPRAVLEAGMSVHQVIALGAPLTVPGSSTFYWDATGSVVTAEDACQINPGKPTFQ